MCFVVPFIFTKVIDFCEHLTKSGQLSCFRICVLLSTGSWAFWTLPKGQITISVQTFPDNKNRRVKWCYKTRNRTKLKIYQRKTSNNPFFSQGIVFDHRSADLKKKKKQKNKLVALSRSTLKWVSQMFVLFFLQSIVIFSFFTFLLLFLSFLSNLVFLHLKLIFWGVLPSLNIFLATTNDYYT